MRANYDVEAKALYVYIEQDDETSVKFTEHLVTFVGRDDAPMGEIFVDIGPVNELVGIEFLDIELETGP